MSEILLRELSNADLDWLVTTGQRQQLQATDVLVTPKQPLEALYVLLEGHWVVRSPHGDREIAQLSRGAMVGEDWLFDTSPMVSVAAADSAIALAVPKAELTQKLQQDVGFAAHFYRAVALISSERIRTLFENSELLRYKSGRMVKEALFVFGKLHDSDIDWMVNAGVVEKLPTGKVLLQMGRPVDALYTVLDGQLAIATTDSPCDPLSACMKGLEAQNATKTFNPIAYISRGGLPGIISFLDFQPLPVRVHAVREALLLAIPRQKVAIKLQEDLGFAARFYQVIATQMANLLATVITAGEAAHSAYGTSSSSNERDGNELDGDELDLDALQQVSQGGAKFDWMLKHLGVGCR